MPTLRSANVRSPRLPPMQLAGTKPVTARRPSPSVTPLPKAAPNPNPVKPINQSNALNVLFALKTRYSQWMKVTPSLTENKPWPAGMDPANAPVYARNETFIPNAKASDVFKMLVRASNWESYYPNATNVRVDGGGDLKLGARFTWRTFANDLKSEVTLFEQDRALGWTFENAGVKGYHRWFVKQEAKGVRLITEEVERGVVPTLGAPVMNRALPAAHQLWVESLKARILGKPLP